MRIFHFIPRAEVDVHECDAGCSCEPMKVEAARLEDTSWEGEIVYQHQPFGPEDIQDGEPDGQGGTWLAFDARLQSA